MRTVLLITLLASAAAAPAQLSDRGGDDRRAQREERREARDERRQERRSEPRLESSSTASNDESPPPRAQAARGSDRPRLEPHNEAPAMRRHAGEGGRWRGRDGASPSAIPTVQHSDVAPVGESAASGGSQSSDRPRRRAIADSVRRAPGADGDRVFDRQVRTTPGFGNRRVGRIGRNVPAEGTAPPPPSTAELQRGSTTRHWRGDWRSDRRYDWRRHRDRNRSRFHIGFYFDPFGWNYRRYRVGWRLWPSYYSHDYWLNDPWHYRLPPAYGPYRWIRYHDDALLVNIYTGEVADVIYDFFW